MVCDRVARLKVSDASVGERDFRGKVIAKSACSDSLNVADGGLLMQGCAWRRAGFWRVFLPVLSDVEQYAGQLRHHQIALALG